MIRVSGLAKETNFKGAGIWRRRERQLGSQKAVPSRQDSKKDGMKLRVGGEIRGSTFSQA